MNSFIIFVILYLILIPFDLIPAFRKKEKRVLFFSIPVYVLTFTLDVMFGFGANLIDPNRALADLISSIFHISI